MSDLIACFQADPWVQNRFQFTFGGRVFKYPLPHMRAIEAAIGRYRVHLKLAAYGRVSRAVRFGQRVRNVVHIHNACAQRSENACSA